VEHRVTAPPPTLVQRALGGHAAIGLLASGLLYLIALSGTLIVIHDRWQRWEQPTVAETGATLSPSAAQAAIAAGLAAAPGTPATTHLYLRLPDAALPRAVVTTDHGAWYVDAKGHIVAPEGHAWTEFVIGLHEYLHLPTTWGLMLVGALGVMLVALVLTGVLAHPRIVRDAFRLRARQDGGVARADWHNRLGVWTLPFALAVAITGAVIGLGAVGFDLYAKAYTGGDLERAYAPIFGHEPAPDPHSAPLPDVAAALRTLASRVPDAVPIYVTVHDPATRGQHVQILAEHPRRLIYGESYAFDAAGRWHGAVGLADGAIGKQAMASSYNLHFGNFAGLPVEIAYMAMGLALCVVTATGTTLWLNKRRRRGLPSERLAACWHVVIWGAPLLLVLALWVRAALGAEAPLVVIFWGGLALGIAAAVMSPRRVGALKLRGATLAAVLATAIGHVLLLRPMGEVLALDAVAAALVLLTLISLRYFARGVSTTGASSRLP
jgi:uncharacterized iron-regulated membrane protein